MWFPTQPKFENIDDLKVADTLAESKKEAVFAGLTGGLASAVLGSKAMRFNRNTSIFCGVASGILSGWFFYQAFYDTAVAQLRAEDIKRGLAKVGAGQDGGESAAGSS